MDPTVEARLNSPLESLIKDAHKQRKPRRGNKPASRGAPKKHGGQQGASKQAANKKGAGNRPASPPVLKNVRPADVKVTIRNEFATSSHAASSRHRDLPRASRSPRRSPGPSGRSAASRYFDFDRAPGQATNVDYGAGASSSSSRRPYRPPPSRLPKIRKP